MFNPPISKSFHHVNPEWPWNYNTYIFENIFLQGSRKKQKRSLYFNGSFMYHCTALSVIITKPKFKESVQFLQFSNSFISKMTTRECIMTLKVHYLHFENILLQGSRKKQEGLPILVVFTCTIPQHQCKDYETKANCSLLI